MATQANDSGGGGAYVSETEADESTTTTSEDQSGNEADISGKEFRYNPPMHASNLFRVVDFGQGKAGTGKKTTAEFYDEDGAPKSYKEEWAKENLSNLRLGRIIQHHIAPGQVSQLKYRWGFRFHYNPTSITYVSSRNDTFVIDPRSTTNTILSGVNQNFQNISFTVLLDRLPDVASGIPEENQYSPSLSSEDKGGILRYGTHWDMEALLRIANGDWELTDRGKTSNIGVLMPSNARLILGPGLNFFGFISGVVWKDEMFLGDMIPVRTRLDITFKRHVEMTSEQAKNSFPGIAQDSEPVESSDSGGGGTSSGGTTGNNKNAPVPGYNTVTTPYGKRGDIWSAGYHQGDDYGLGGIGGKWVHTTKDGIIKYVASGGGGWGSWAGNHVVVQTGNVQHGYCHMASHAGGLTQGASISAGTAVGKVGKTGHVTGTHLHYEERINGKPRSPLWGNK